MVYNIVRNISRKFHVPKKILQKIQFSPWMIARNFSNIFFCSKSLRKVQFVKITDFWGFRFSFPSHKVTRFPDLVIFRWFMTQKGVTREKNGWNQDLRISPSSWAPGIRHFSAIFEIEVLGNSSYCLTQLVLLFSSFFLSGSTTSFLVVFFLLIFLKITLKTRAYQWVSFGNLWWVPPMPPPWMGETTHFPATVSHKFWLVCYTCIITVDHY